MLIRFTDELKDQALEVANQYKPLAPPLLVGSCVWLGEGKDIDVVVFVDDASADVGGEPCSDRAYGRMVAWRHGHVNIIAVEDGCVWAGWRHAAEIMPNVPKELIGLKKDRVEACEKLRELGELQCLLSD